jgi:hypothetical protein
MTTVSTHIDAHVPHEMYRASPGLSYSETKLLERTPLHLRWARDNPQLSKPTPAMMLGTGLHCALLEPARFDVQYVMEPAPNMNKNSNAWKEFADACRVQSLTPISIEDRERILGMIASIRRNEKAAKVLGEGQPEVSAWWSDPTTQVACKGRLDWVHPLQGGTLPVDVKTSADASPEAFARSVVNFAYHRQADWYERGFELASGRPTMPMMFIVVETTAPFACACYTLDPYFMVQARKDNERLLALYAHCCEMGEWPGYDPSIVELSPPAWALDAEVRAQMREEAAYS